MASESLERARRRYEDAERQVRSAEHYGNGRDLQEAIDHREETFKAVRAAIRAEAVAEWREAVEAAIPYFVAGNLVVDMRAGSSSLLPNDTAEAALARLRALLEDSQEGANG